MQNTDKSHITCQVLHKYIAGVIGIGAELEWFLQERTNIGIPTMHSRIGMT